MTNLERMRQKQQAIAAPAEKPSGGNSPTSPPKEERPAKAPKPKAAPQEVVRHSCGHEVAVRHYAGQPCNGCKNKARQQRNAARRENSQPGQAKMKAERGGRLPDHSTFAVAYHAEKVEWSGTLIVEGVSYHGTASGVERLLRDLAQKYREAVKP